MDNREITHIICPPMLYYLFLSSIWFLWFLIWWITGGKSHEIFVLLLNTYLLLFSVLMSLMFRIVWCDIANPFFIPIGDLQIILMIISVLIILLLIRFGDQQIGIGASPSLRPARTCLLTRSLSHWFFPALHVLFRCNNCRWIARAVIKYALNIPAWVAPQLCNAQ